MLVVLVALDCGSTLGVFLPAAAEHTQDAYGLFASELLGPVELAR